MRGWMSAAPSYLPPVEIGEVMRALAVGRVTASRNEGFAEGELVQGMFGVLYDEPTYEKTLDAGRFGARVPS